MGNKATEAKIANNFRIQKNKNKPITPNESIYFHNK